MIASRANRILLALLLAPSLLLTAAPSARVRVLVAEPTTIDTPPPLRGDVNGDGTVSSADALAILNHVVGRELPTTHVPVPNGDTDCNGAVTSKDALIVLMHVVGEDVRDACVGKPIVAVIIITPATASLSLGDTVRVAAHVLDADGDTIPDAVVTWSSSDTLVAVIDSTGLATALSAGEAKLTATSYGDTASAAVTVSVITTTVMLGSDVSPAARSFLTTIYSLADSTDLDSATLVRVPARHVPHAVAITNAAGEPILGAIAQPTGTTLVDAHTTAIVLGRSVVVAALLLAEKDTSGIQGHLTAHPAFNSLVQAIRTESSAGQSYLASPNTMQQAGEIALDIINAHAPIEGDAAIQAGDPFALPNLPLSVRDTADSDFAIVNVGYINFVAASFFVQSEADTVIVGEANVSKRAFKVSANLGTPTRTLLGGQDGKLLVRVGQNLESRTKNAIDFFEAYLAIMCEVIGIKVRNDLLHQLAASVLMPSTLEELEAATPAQRAAIVSDIFIENAPYFTQEILKSLNGRGYFRAGVGYFFRNVINVMKAVRIGAEVLSRGHTIKDYFAFGSDPAEQVTRCQRQGEFVVCPDRLVVTPSALRLLPNATQALEATVYDADGAEIDDAELFWQSRNGLIAEVDQTGEVDTKAEGRTYVVVSSKLDTTVRDSISVEVTTDLFPGARLAGAGSTVCALGTTGRASCWGVNYQGQVGDGTTEGRTVPTAVSSELAFLSITSSGEHTCAIATDRRSYCWGGNSFAQLGDGTDSSRVQPQQVASVRLFKQIFAGGEGSCALSAEGEAACWGVNWNGGVGDGTLEPRNVPTPVATELRFIKLALGRGHVCGLVSYGETFCWGTEPGVDGPAEGRTRPVQVATSLAFVDIFAGDYHTCGLTADMTAYCWGDGGSGQLGTGTTANQLAPVAVAGGLQFKTLSLGQMHSCGVMVDGRMFCWGSNDYGQIGDNTTVQRNTPVPVLTELRFLELAAGYLHTCAKATDDQIYCWGNNANGELGNGTNEDQLIPTPVVGTPLDVRRR